MFLFKGILFNNIVSSLASNSQSTAPRLMPELSLSSMCIFSIGHVTAFLLLGSLASYLTAATDHLQMKNCHTKRGPSTGSTRVSSPYLSPGSSPLFQLINFHSLNVVHFCLPLLEIIRSALDLRVGFTTPLLSAVSETSTAEDISLLERQTST